MLNHYDTFFVLGKRGRFGLAFSALLRDITLEFFEFSSAEVSFEDGISETIEWYKSNEKWWRPLVAS